MTARSSAWPPTGRRVSDPAHPHLPRSRTTWSPSTGRCRDDIGGLAPARRAAAPGLTPRVSRAAPSRRRGRPARASGRSPPGSGRRPSARRSPRARRGRGRRGPRRGRRARRSVRPGARRRRAATRTQPRVAVLGRDAQQVLADGRDRAPGALLPRRVGRGVHDDLPDDAPARMAGLAPGDEEPGQGVRDDGAAGLRPVGVEMP